MVWENKPSQNENEYFARKDAEWLKEQRAKLDEERAARSKTINCPRCGKPLLQRTFGQVTVDSCTNGHGVWFDSGELEMLIHGSEKEMLRIARELDA